MACKETAMGLERSGHALVITLEASLLYRLSPNLYLEAASGYTTGSDKVNGVSAKLGGFTAGVGLAVRL